MFRENLERMAEIYGGIAIFSVTPGSTTHRAGVRAGDILVAVNGRRVSQVSDYASARSLRRQLLQLVVVRSGRELTLWAGDPPEVQDRSPAANCGTRGLA
jgi:S1-C subfamily serine protease